MLLNWKMWTVPAAKKTMWTYIRRTFYLLESEDADLVETFEIPAAFGNVLLTNEDGAYEVLPTFALDDYRKLEIKDSVSYTEFLNVYKPPFLRNFTSFTLAKIVLKEDNHLVGILSEKIISRMM